MKKLFALILAVAMLATMSVTAFAAVDQDSADPNGSMNVTYSVAPTYTVTIPATVALGETATIQAENVVVPKGKQVEVTLTNANGFTVATPQGAELSYTVKNGETTVNEGDTVLAVNPTSGKTGETTLTFTTPETVKFAGDYTGTVAFTIAVKDVPTINFTIDGTAYQAEEGMTWENWIASEYNELGLIIDGNYIACPIGVVRVWDNAIGDNPVITDEIVAGRSYGIYG